MFGFCFLLEGSSIEIRENAADQLGEIASQTPEYCQYIFKRLRPLITDKEWDTRVASIRSLDAVSRLVSKNFSFFSTLANVSCK
jgi:hypothetical protein